MKSSKALKHMAMHISTSGFPTTSRPETRDQHDHGRKSLGSQIPGLVVVIPTFNNELSIGTLVILSKIYAPDVLVIDSGSTDRTVEVAERAGADAVTFPGPHNRGKSLLEGAKRAFGYNCRVVVFLDSNGEHMTRYIPRLVRQILKGSDLVIGSRTLGGRKGIHPFNPDKKEKSCELPEETEMFLNTDPGSTFRAISVRGISLLDALPCSDQFESMMVSLFQNKGLALKEIPITIRHEVTEKDDNLPRYRGKKVAVVVPAHNEQLLIGETLAGIPDFVARVYVVNDCSTDRTREILDHYAGQDPSIIPIHHKVNQGVGAAIATGYKRALLDDMDIVAVMAGDNQMDPVFLPEILNPVVDLKCDYTMGNRLINPNYRAGMSSWRFVGNTVLTLLTKIASGYWSMMDPQNGYTAISKRALERINIDSMYPRYGYCNDLLVKLNVIGFRVINVPHPARYGMETSGIAYSTYIVKVSKLLLDDFLWRLKMKYVVLSFHPLVFFYFSGVIFSILGILAGIYALYDKFVLGNPIFVPLTLSLLIFGFGLISLFFAMFYDMQQEKGTDGWYS